MSHLPCHRCASILRRFRTLLARTLLSLACLSLLAASAMADGKPQNQRNADESAAGDKATGDKAAGNKAAGEKSAGKDPKAADEKNPMLDFNWQKGPGVGTLGTLAEVKIPEGCVFLDGPDTIRFLTVLQNPTNGSELGTLMTTSGDWFLIFEFSDIGYVKDDDGGKLDADAILSSLRAGTERSNEERRRRGWSEMKIVGWEQKPHYDSKTHNLEWGIRGESEGHSNINYNIRVLGRGGVMAATLVAGPDHIAAALPETKQLLTGFSFTNGNKYSEFRPGDHVAEIGLSALVAGGGLAMAAKTGLLAKLGLLLAKGWKLIVLAVVAVGAGIKKLFTGRRSTT